MALTINAKSLTTSTFGFQDNGPLQFISSGGNNLAFSAGVNGGLCLDFGDKNTAGFCYAKNQHSPLWGQNEFSVSLWFKLPAAANISSNTKTLVAKYETYPAEGWLIGVRNSGGLYGMSTAYGYGHPQSTLYRVYTEYGTVTLDAWHHVVWIYNNRNVKIYLNNVLSGEGTGPADMVMDYEYALYVGNNINENISVKMEGQIDELMFFNRALTEAEVEDIYTFVDPVNPSGWYKFEENAGNQTFDTVTYYNNPFINQVNALSVTGVLGFRNMSSSKTNCRPMLLYY